MTHAPREVPANWASDWNVALRLWVERKGNAILGRGRLDLLEAIDRWHSISAAARQLGMSYRRAWLLVQSVNEAADQPLVVAATGGSHGGGAHLTNPGRRAISVFRTLLDRVQHSAAAHLAELVQSPSSTTLHVAASVSLEEVLGSLLADYALQRPDVRVRSVFGAGDELADHLRAGAPGDLFLTADAAQLRGLAGPGVPLAENNLAVVAIADRVPVVRKPADLVKPGVARIAVAEPQCPLGRYTQDYLKKQGLWLNLRLKLLQVDNSRAVLSVLRAGQADVGVTYTSDVTRVDGIRTLFLAEAGAHGVRYVAGVLRRARQPDAALDLLHFLTSVDASRRFRSCGFLPVRRPARKKPAT